VTIPAFNEEGKIGAVVKSIPRKIDKVSQVRVVVVDDGSADATRSEALNAGADIVYTHKRNRGVGQAFKTAIRIANSIHSDIIVNIDADGQFSADEIPRIIQPILDNKADVVIGSRFLEEKDIGIPSMKLLGNRIFTRVVGIVTGRRLTDTQTGFRALTGDAAKKLELAGIFTYTQEMVLDLAFKNFRLVDVPVSVKYFKGRKSRVVKSISGYTLRAVSVVMMTVLRNFKLHLGSILLTIICLLAAGLLIP
jgi:glycosyltransferase involved in cell wall biosynthesis